MSEKKQIKVRIACVVTPSGAWSACGGSETDDWGTNAEDGAHDGLCHKYEEHPQQMYYITATLDIPAESVPIEITGEVEK